MPGRSYNLFTAKTAPVVGLANLPPPCSRSGILGIPAGAIVVFIHWRVAAARRAGFGASAAAFFLT